MTAYDDLSDEAKAVMADYDEMTLAEIVVDQRHRLAALGGPGALEWGTNQVLTDVERKTLEHLAAAARGFFEMIESGPSGDLDAQEMVAHIHSLQNAVIAQGMARLFPHEFRVMGGTVRPRPEPKPNDGGPVF